MYTLTLSQLLAFIYQAQRCVWSQDRPSKECPKCIHGRQGFSDPGVAPCPACLLKDYSRIDGGPRYVSLLHFV